MSSDTPLARLVGTWKIWMAACSQAEPDIDDSTLTGWTEVARTDGDQVIRWTGDLVMGSDNEINAPRLHLRPEQGFEIEARVIHQTLENIARAIGVDAAGVTTGTSGGDNVKILNIARNYRPYRAAILLRGGALPNTNKMSAYMAAGKGQIWIPKGVVSSSPELTFNKSNTEVPMQLRYTAEWDDTMSTGQEMGRLLMETA